MVQVMFDVAESDDDTWRRCKENSIGPRTDPLRNTTGQLIRVGLKVVVTVCSLLGEKLESLASDAETWNGQCC